MTRRSTIRLSVLLAVALAIAGCGRRSTQSPVLARVGDQVLTLADAREHVDTAGVDVAGQIRRYIGVWVNNELVYQEAARNGIDRSESVRRQVDDAGRQIVAQEYLRQVLFADLTAVPDDSLRAYYARHAGDFFVHEDMLNANIALFASREHASAFAAAVAQGAAWAAALKDSVTSTSLLSSAAGVFTTAHTIAPPELWRVGQGLGPGDVSYPVKTDAGFAIIQVLKAFRQGTPASFEIARDEIQQRIMVEFRQRRYDSLLAQLRGRAQAQINVTITATDTVPHHE